MSEHEEKIIATMQHYYPAVVEIAGMYNNQYPAASTPGEVIDAVTVAVPLRLFMVMSAVCGKVIADMAALVPAEEPTL